VPSIISQDMILRGEFTGGGDLQIEGQVIGRIDTDHLVITETGVVEGDVIAKAVAISGTLRGTIHAANVTLSSTAKVNGNILHEVLMIEAGAQIEGECKRIAAPAEDRVLKLTEEAQVVEPVESVDA